jgi:hypothetical protein
MNSLTTDLLLEHIKFQKEIVNMDFNNGVQISMKVFYKMLESVEKKAIELKQTEIDNLSNFFDAGVKAMDNRGVYVRAMCEYDEFFKQYFNNDNK